MAKKGSNKYQSVPSTDSMESTFERSIGSLSKTMTRLVDKIDDLNKKIDDQTKAIKSSTESTTKTTKPQKTRGKSKEMQSFENMLGKRGEAMFKGIEGVFGKKSMKSVRSKMFQGFAGKGATGGAGGIGGKLLGGGLKAAGGSMAGMAGMALKAAGPIGAALSAAHTLVDFFNSGDAAKASANFGSFFGVDTTAMTTALFKMSKEYRKIIADFNYVQPVKFAFQARRDILDFEKGIETDNLTFQQSLVTDQYDYEIGLIRDQIQFRQNQAAQTLDAENARRKALFTADMTRFKSAIKISERALQAIGSSAESVLESVKNIGISLGASLKEQVSLSTAAAGMGASFMASSDDVLKMTNTFRLMDKSSAKNAANMLAGVSEFAKMNDMQPAQLFKQMSESQEEIFKYSNHTTTQFAQQAVLLANMNTSMSAMAKASDTMVLNYKDSIKAEMSLSAMLGKNVNLSEVRARLMAGDQAGGAAALKSALGGIDIGTLNPFAKQQLTQATGMNIEELMGLTQSKGGGVKGTIDQKNAMKTGADIANGALKQDIANEAAKLALDQKNRAEMMKFEQVARKNMLAIEQQQRLENLAIEQKWRLKYAALDTEESIAVAVAEMEAEASTKMINNIFRDSAMTMKDISASTKMQSVDFQKSLNSVKSQLSSDQQLALQLTKSKVINPGDTNFAKYQAALTKFETTKDLKQAPKLSDYLSTEQMKAGKVAGAQAKYDEARKAQIEGTGLWDSIFNYGKVKKINKDVKTAEEQLKILKDNSKTITQDSANLEKLKSSNMMDNNFLSQQNNQLIAMAGATNILLEGILQSTEAGKQINLDGKKVNSKLLANARTNYALARPK